MKPRPFLTAALTLSCVFVGSACRAGQGVHVKLTRGGAALADADVELRFENPPGGWIQLRTDAQGRVEIPPPYAGLRAQVGWECERPGACHHYSKEFRLEGVELTTDVSGGLSFP
jgi:hypothetical protein